MNRIKFDLLRYKASLGNADALFELYEIYGNGDEELGIPEDYEKAKECLQKSADKGYAPAVGDLGYMYIQLSDNPEKGLEMEIEAADNGYVPSMYRVGEYFFTGKTFVMNRNPENLKVDVPRAIEYWEKAARQDDVKSCLAYAKAIIMGVGLKEKYPIALDYLNFVCDEIVNNSDAENLPTFGEALFWKGYLYYYGLGVPADEDMANIWFKQSKAIKFNSAIDVIDDGVDPRQALMNWSNPYDFDTWYKLYCEE